MSNNCCGKTRRLLASNATGSISSVSVDAPGKIQNLVCCEKPAHPPKQELVVNWKRKRAFLLSTIPVGYGYSSFSTGGQISISGPPKPGDDATIRGGRIIEPPPPPPLGPPVVTPIPDGGLVD
jgi:hypothetical protein